MSFDSPEAGFNHPKIVPNRVERIDTTPTFWLRLEPNEQHTRESYDDFLENVPECRLVAELCDCLSAWGIKQTEEVALIFAQAELSANGEPDFDRLSELTCPDIATRLGELYHEKLSLKEEYKNNEIKFTSEYFGESSFNVVRKRSQSDKAPILILPGCLTGNVSLPNTVASLAQLGADVVAVDTAVPNTAGAIQYYDDNREQRVARTAVNAAYTSSVVDGMSVYEELLGLTNEQAEMQKYNLYGYSTSAAAVLQAALQRPDKVETVSLVCPIGTTNEYESAIANVLKLFAGIIAHGKQNTALGEPNQNAVDYFTGYIERQNIRGWREIIRIIGNTVVTELAEAIYALVVEKDIPVTVLLGGEDKLFSPDDSVEYLEKVQSTIPPDETTSLEVVVLPDQTHNHLGRNPEYYARVLHAGIDEATETKRHKKSLEPLLAAA